MPSSLLSRATETDALIVCINGVVLAMNLMLLSLTLQVASSGTSIFLAMLLLEIALDKVYVLLSLVSTLPLDIVVLLLSGSRMCRHHWRCGNLRLPPHLLVARILCADKLYVGDG